MDFFLKTLSKFGKDIIYLVTIFLVHIFFLLLYYVVGQAPVDFVTRFLVTEVLVTYENF